MQLLELFAKLTADTSGFDQAMNNADRSGKSLKNSLENTFSKIQKFAASALSVAAIKKGVDAVINLANEVAAAGDKIDKQSQALGLSRKAYQEWEYILGQNGASIDSLGVSMKTLNSLVLSAAEGGEEAKTAFAKLGIGIHEIETLSVEDQFEAVVRAFQRMPAGAQKSALAVQMFGRNGMELLPLLNQSETSIDELRARAEELGLIMSDDAVDAAVVYGDSLDDLKRTFDSFKYAIGAKILPVLTKGIQGITNYAGKLRRAYDSNGLKGIWDTLVADFKNIKWPTWKDVKNAATIAWNTIVDGAKGLAGLVFGTKEDGSVDWPTWDTVKKKAVEIWDGIKDGARKLAGLVFGTKEDGSVDWPDLSTILESFNNWWDNTVKPAIQNAATWTLKLFGLPEESVDQIGSIISGWWDPLKNYVEGLLDWALHLPDSPHEAGEALAKIIKGWWDGTRANVEAVLKWAIGLFDIGDASGSETVAKISAWWSENVTPILGKALDFVLGLFGLPPAAQMGEKIKAWWEEVKAYVGKLVYNATVNLLTGGSSTGDDSWTNNKNSNYNPAGWDLLNPIGHAKGLDYVPHDNYLASLHRGEKVLTASQARREREGGNGNASLTALTQAVVGAIQQGMSGATVNSYINGRSVTDDVSRRQMNRVKARRFAGG